MKSIWFKRKWLFFFPVHLMGWMIAAASLALTIYVFMDIDRRSHSVSDTLINFVFNALVIAAGYSLIAYFMSARGERE